MYTVLMRDMSFRLSTPWVIALFAVIGFAIYGSSLNNTFVTWDDTYLIYYNPFVKDISFHTVYSAFSTFDPELYVPLTILSYQLDFAFAGMNPAMFHFTNLILHIGNAVLVWKLLEVLTKNRTASVIAGCVFLMHPLQTEAIAWASARKDVLSTFFFLGSILFYMHWRQEEQRSSYWMSVGSLFLGLLAKVMIVTLPVILLMIDWMEGRRGWTMVKEKIPHFALSIIFGLIGVFGKQTVLESTNTWEKILMAGKSTVFYLSKFFLPFEFSVMYPFNEEIAASSPAFWVPWLIIAVIAAVTILSLRSTRVITFGVGFYALTLMPTFTNFMKGGDAYIASDRYAYIPLIGILFLLICCINVAVRKMPAATERFSQLSLAVSCLLLLVLGAKAQAQAATWENSETLYRHVLSIHPDAIAARINLAQILREKDGGAEALEHLLAAEKIRDHARIHTVRASILNKAGRIDEAIAECNVALTADPADPIGHYCLGVLYEEKGWTDQAMAEYELALAKSPTFVSVRNNIGLIHLQRGEYDNAYDNLIIAAEADPHLAEVQYNLGLLEEDRGNYEQAAIRFERTMEIEGDTVETLTKLVGAYSQLNDKESVIRTLKRILAIDRDNALATKMMQALGASE